MALSDSCHQLMWIRSLFSEIGIEISFLPLCGNNQGALFIAQNPVQECRSKHIAIRYHYVRERVELEEIELFYVPTDNNIADIFTKNLAYLKFEKFRGQLGIKFH